MVHFLLSELMLRPVRGSGIVTSEAYSGCQFRFADSGYGVASCLLPGVLTGDESQPSLGKGAVVR